MKKPEPLKIRLKKLVIIDSNGCWRCTLKSRVGDGYVRINTGSRRDGTRKNQLAHRVSYETFIGPIPEGMTIDHLCEVTDCINPKHLKAKSSWDNTKRSKTSPTAVNARKTKCPQCGEKYSIKKNGHRYCRPCYLEYLRWYNANCR